MSKSGFEIDGGWVGTAIILAICLSMGPIGWFIGVMVLRNKLKGFNRGKNEVKQFRKIGTSLLAAGGGMTVFGLAAFGLPVLIAGAVVLWYAKRSSDREQRYRRYMAIIGDKDYMAIGDIARTIQQPVDQVREELQYMIDQGWFGANTYIDLRTMCIEIKDRTAKGTYRTQPIYAQPEPEVSYEQKQREEEARRTAVQAQRRAEEAERRAAEAEKRAAEERRRADEQAEAIREMQDRANAQPKEEMVEDDQFEKWLRAIREVNDRIDDQVISDKIDRIELLTRRIFEMVRLRPEKEGQIRKFLSYYLPTTMKLLDSYALLEKQGIEGENISAAKQKIEGIMDTLIDGFERQLDQLFSAQAMDITSDIQVLESMMAVDGLKENEFSLKKTASAGK